MQVLLTRHVDLFYIGVDSIRLDKLRYYSMYLFDNINLLKLVSCDVDLQIANIRIWFSNRERSIEHRVSRISCSWQFVHSSVIEVLEIIVKGPFAITKDDWH